MYTSYIIAKRLSVKLIIVLLC